MTLLKDKKFSLYLFTVISIIVLVGIFAFSVVYIGYREFERSFANEYNSSALNAANTCATYIDGDDIDDYLNNPEDYEIKSEYDKVNELMTDITEVQNMSVIFVIVPTSEYNYYTAVFDAVPKDSEYEPWKIGHVEQVVAEDSKQLYQQLWEGHAEYGFIARLSSTESRPHVTACVPIKSSTTGEVKAILCAQRYVAQLQQAKRKYALSVGIVTFVISLIVIYISIQTIGSKIIKPIKAISDEAERFAAENTKTEKNSLRSISDIIEINGLAESIDKMEYDTVNYIRDLTAATAEKERLGADLDLAARIQNGMLMNKPLDRPEVDMAASMTPAKGVGGDFYDYFMVDDTHVAILVADVSDKGVGAAFFMSLSKTIIKTLATRGERPGEIIKHADMMISEKNSAGMFVTVWLGIIDLTNGHVVACNAGHDYPAIYREGQGFAVVKEVHGPPVAFMPDMDFPEIEYDLKPGERIFLYTDGLTDAKSIDGDRFGIDRIIEVLNANRNHNNESLLTVMRRAVDNFIGEEPLFDDTTMLGFTYLGPAQSE